VIGHGLIAAGVVVAILTLGLALATAVGMALPEFGRRARSVGDWLAVLFLVPIVVLLALGPVLVSLMFLGIGIALIVTGANTADGGHVAWGIILAALGVIFAWTAIRD
jgi:hypothetical protein